MTLKIDKKIVGWSVKDAQEPVQAPVETVHERMGRPERLTGKTYKINKSANHENALYVTLNDKDGKPFEIFLNSKDMNNFQWIVALTRVISAVFRNGGNCAFLIEELKNIHNPGGGYFRKGRYVPSLVSEIGDVLEQHLIGLGLYQKDDSLAIAAQMMVQEKLETKKADKQGEQCSKCGEFSVVLLDNCLTCLSCGASKCG